MSDATLIPLHGRLAGIDYGRVRVGIAICDPDRILASPFSTYERRERDADGRYFQELAREERIVAWIVGLPVHMSGDESEKSREARRFGEWLAAATGLPVAFHDERFTTSEAVSRLAEGGQRNRRGDPRRDMLAAQAILARFLEQRSASPPGPIDEP